MIRRALLVLIVMLFAFGDVAEIGFVGDAVAQEQPAKKRRTLMDLFFGEPEPPPAAVEAPAITTPKQSAAPAAPAKPKVEKAETATRLAVFGDSMGVDIAKALDRYFAEDPNIVVINKAEGSSGFVREDYFDWGKAAADEVAANSFDIAVMVIGINDRQAIEVNGKSYKSLTPEWNEAYRSRVSNFVSIIRAANKPLIWIGLPPTSRNAEYDKAMVEVNSIQRLAVFGGGAEFLDIYDRFISEEGKYSSFGPDLNGNRVRLRKDDNIHFNAAGSDKVVYFLSQSIKQFYTGSGGVSVAVADALAGTEAGLMVRPPYQGLGQTRLLEVAGAVIPLTQVPRRAIDLVTASAPTPLDEAFDLMLMIEAPQGRVDDFGVGVVPVVEAASTPVAATP